MGGNEISKERTDEEQIEEDIVLDLFFNTDMSKNDVLKELEDRKERYKRHIIEVEKASKEHPHDIVVKYGLYTRKTLDDFSEENMKEGSTSEATHYQEKDETLYMICQTEFQQDTQRNLDIHRGDGQGLPTILTDKQGECEILGNVSAITESKVQMCNKSTQNQKIKKTPDTESKAQNCNIDTRGVKQEAVDQKVIQLATESKVESKILELEPIVEIGKESDSEETVVEEEIKTERQKKEEIAIVEKETLTIKTMKELSKRIQGADRFSAIINHRSPFLIDNVRHFEQVIGRKQKLLLQEVTGLLPAMWFGNLTLDSWNEAMTAVRFTNLYTKISQDPEIKPFIIYLRAIGEEFFLAGSIAEKTATSFIRGDKTAGTDMDLMVCFPLPGEFIDLDKRPGYLCIRIGTQDPWAKDENNFMYSRDFLDTQMHLLSVEPTAQNYEYESIGGTSGPAIAIFEETCKDDKQQDLVYGFYKRDQWPSVAEEWCHRKRFSGWPSQVLINRIVSYGTYVVPIFHPHSKNPDIEWRYSFSRAEIDLILSLTKKQRKCFMYAKRICKLLFAGFKLLSTYHVKTVFFWMMEELPREAWESKNYIVLVDMLFSELVSFLSKLNLPNYFIKEANIIDHLPPEHIKTAEDKITAMRTPGLEPPIYIQEDICLSLISAMEEE